MSMTKGEKAEMEALRKARDMARSLRWPEYVSPTPRTVEEIRSNAILSYKTEWLGSGKVSAGWDYNAYNGVHEHWSTGNSQTTMNPFTGDSKRTSWSQNAGRQFATRIEALQAMRMELTERYAMHLAKIDAEIAVA